MKFKRFYSSKNAQWLRPRIKSLYFDPYRFSLESFIDVILNNFKPGVSYSLLFKLKYIDNNGVKYGMSSKQRPFKMLQDNNKESIVSLYDDMVNLFDIFVDRYNVDDIELIQVLYIVVKDIPELKLKNINNIRLNKLFFKIKDTRNKFSSKSLPLTTNVAYYGKLLLSNVALHYLSIINEYNKSLIDINDIDSMYLYQESYIILNYKIKNNVYERRVYSVKSGMLYYIAIDSIIDNNTFSRTINQTTTVISNDKIIKISSNKELQSMKYNQQVYKASSNPFIGSIDLETYVDKDGYAKVYALGFYTKVEAEIGKSPNTFYLENNISSSELVLKCIDSMLTSKYNNYTFYAHNLGGFDSIFILNILKTANVNLGFDYYKLDYIFRDNKLLKLEIKVEIDSNTPKESGYYKITLIDSYNLLRSSLYNLSRAFELSIIKGYFPHKFVNIDTINYVGNTPSLEYWNEVSSEEYKKFYSKTWSVKNECIKYLNKDLISLYKIMDTFNKFIYRKYGVQMTNCLTISRLALNIFLKNYLKDSKIPLIPESIYNDIKKAYFGGVTEVYKPYGKELYYYDVNSLYPYVALNSMPGLNCKYIDNIHPKDINLKEFFGFYYCEVETKNNYLGLLPVHSKFELIMPNGKWCGWYFSEELKLAFDNGYKIKIIKGYNFNKVNNVFDEYVKDLYELKATSDGSIKAIAKSLLNNLLGRLGLNIKKPVSEIVDDDKLNLIHSTREVLSTINVTEKDYLVTYYPSISKNICDSYELDYIKIISNYSKDIEVNKEFKDASIAIAAAVTSYARVHMSKIKLDILSKGGSIYYTDTDSIVTDIPLSDNLVGKNLGQFKLEHKVKEGYFISSKTYCLVIYDGIGVGFIMISIIIKAKGLNSSSITLEDFKNMYKGINVVGIKQNTETNYEKGSVIIGQKEVILDHNSYKKREKVYQNSKWVDTRPLSYKNNNSYNTNGTIGNREFNSIANKYYYKNISNNKICTCNKKHQVVNTKFDYTYYVYSGLVLLLAILYFYIPYIIDVVNELYSNYIQELHRIKGDHIRFIMENRITCNKTIEEYSSIDYNKISKFVDINSEWRYEIKNLLKRYDILLPILNQLDINFHSITSLFNTTPYLDNSSNLLSYIFEERPLHLDINVNNPLGIQGIEYHVDQAIDLINKYMLEYQQERLNYESNLLYILINRLTPSSY